MALLQLETSSGEVIHVETQGNLESPAATQNAVVVKKFADIGQSIVTVCSDVFSKINLAELEPDELTLEFSLSIGADLSVPFVAKSSGEGTFKVSVTWHKPKPVRKTAPVRKITRPKPQS
jgi:hypothetical protein